MTGWFAPGRIEVLGKHTDYAGGNVLVCAVDRGITCTVEGGGERITARSSLDGDVVDLTPGATSELPAGHWGNYLRATTARLQANFGPLRPARLEITSDLPPASGMSSSSALVVACAMALAGHNELSRHPLWRQVVTDEVQLAGYLACVENGKSFGPLAGTTGVGTQGGSEDHTAMLCSRTGELGWFAFNPPRLVERVALPDGLAFVVAVSGVAAEKTGAAKDSYNAASRRAGAVLERWNEAGHDHAWLADAVGAAGAGELDALVADAPALQARLAQFEVESNHCVPAAVGALRDGDLPAFARAVARSQAAAHAGLANQVPATESLVEQALELGAVAASSFGAGFGGSVWALVAADAAEEFAGRWLTAHVQRFPELDGLASTLVTRPSGSAHPV